MSLPNTLDQGELNAATLQQYQYVFKQLTNKSERLLTFRNDRHKVALDNLLNLHRLIEQTVSTWTVKASSLSITQRSSDNTTERWSSFERFRLHGGAVQRVTNDIELTYDFLIQLPYTPEPSPYKVKISLRNALKELQDLRTNAGDGDAFDFYISGKLATARWDIEYVDISIARTVSHTIASWYDSLPKAEVTVMERAAKALEGYASAVVRAVSALIVATSVLGPAIFSGGEVGPERMLIFVLGLYIVHFFASPLIARLGRTLKLVRTAASISITEPDRQLIESEERGRNTTIKWVWINLALPQAPAALVSLLDSAWRYLQIGR